MVMTKQEAVASLGQDALLRPARMREALRANDRLKLYLTLLQAAAAGAAAPQRPPADLGHEIAAAGIREREDAAWLRELPGLASREGALLALPGFAKLAQRLAQDLGLMARPLMDGAGEPALAPRVAGWTRRLQGLTADALDDALLAELTRARRGDGDSLHLLVMDLHKALNRLAEGLSGETVAGAHAWHLAQDGSDRARVEAFMRGLERTRALKLDHPGLETAATRDGARLLIQNDIGTNDAHVLVLQVEGCRATLTYSDLHRRRFAFFQALLEEVGARWSGLDSQVTPGLNGGQAYWTGTATFEAGDDAVLQQCLEGIGARIVFLIDWNRARKRLEAFVGKEAAVAVLREAARREVGHMAWLAAGGEALVWGAMSAQGGGMFRLGDRLDAVLGDQAAQEWLLELMALAWDAAQRRQPMALVADEARLRLARRLLGRRDGAELLLEHAGWCHALAQAVRDGLAHGVERDPDAAARLSGKAKGHERQADELVARARSRAERHEAWAPWARLAAQADDVADSLEEAAFVLSLVADGHHGGWHGAVRDALQALADAVLDAVQHYVKALAIAAGARDAADQEAMLDALWHVVQAERRCDELLRSARRALAREVRDAAALVLGNELAAALEAASDHLLAVGHALRAQMLQRAGVPA